MTHIYFWLFFKTFKALIFPLFFQGYKKKTHGNSSLNEWAKKKSAESKPVSRLRSACSSPGCYMHMYGDAVPAGGSNEQNDR